ncbi:MAG: hypothetical protein CFH35_01168 [Alphaproteobacteria bacterium MarineAlpha9_Bin5]|jgi:hypothetical protein|nr:MAG: hypothetical protein CFH35_01168 [Alphaproteobacteria bacterium MarineAlpha9_Bin5]
MNFNFGEDVLDLLPIKLAPVWPAIVVIRVLRGKVWKFLTRRKITNFDQMFHM